MQREQLEAALIGQGIAKALATMIAVMAFSPNIERTQNGWMLPVVELDGSTPSKRAQQRFIEVLRTILNASIKERVGTSTKAFPVVSSIQQARDSEFLLYAFTPGFQAWAGLPQVAPSAFH